MFQSQIIERISYSSPWRTARRLAKEEGLFTGISSGANVVVAIKIAENLGSEATVVTLMVDSGLKYLSADLYQKD